MRSIKPGRALSFICGVVSAVFAVVGIVWIAMSASAGLSPFFPTFGAVFIVVGVLLAVYWFKNAFGQTRFSLFDITDGDAEPDPLNAYVGSRERRERERRETRAAETDSAPKPGGFCPACGAKSDPGFAFCGQCGKALSTPRVDADA